MTGLAIFIGIDVVKSRLDVAPQSTGESWQIANDDAAIHALVAGRIPHRSTLNVFATTGGFKYAAANRRRPPGSALEPYARRRASYPPAGRTDGPPSSAHHFPL